MAIRNKPLLGLATLAISHALVLLAGFFAPYQPTSQNREMPFAPPTRIHFLDSHGHPHLRPFVYRWTANAETGGA
jgi:hypothetical protein